MAKSRFNVLSGGALTGPGSSPAFPVVQGSTVEVGISTGTVTGTAVAMNIWAEFSPDNGTTWYPKAYDQALTGTPTAALDLTATSGKTNINGASAWTEASDNVKVSALYRDWPADLMRLTWAMTGTTPSVPVTADVATVG